MSAIHSSSRLIRTLVITLLLARAVISARPVDAQGVNTSVIKLSYRCANWFRIRNANAVDVPVQYSVYRTSERGAITLPAAPTSIGYSDTWVRTQNRGALLLTYSRARVAEKPNGNAGCASAAGAGQWSDTLS